MKLDRECHHNKRLDELFGEKQNVKPTDQRQPKAPTHENNSHRTPSPVVNSSTGMTGSNTKAISTNNSNNNNNNIKVNTDIKSSNGKPPLVPKSSLQLEDYIVEQANDQVASGIQAVGKKKRGFSDTYATVKTEEIAVKKEALAIDSKFKYEQLSFQREELTCKKDFQREELTCKKDLKSATISCIQTGFCLLLVLFLKTSFCSIKCSNLMNETFENLTSCLKSASPYCNNNIFISFDFGTIDFGLRYRFASISIDNSYNSSKSLLSSSSNIIISTIWLCNSLINACLFDKIGISMKMLIRLNNHRIKYIFTFNAINFETL
jgi:hypothetical protein